MCVYLTYYNFPVLSSKKIDQSSPYTLGKRNYIQFTVIF